MFLTVSMDREQRKALVIPEEALVPEQARQFVYVIVAGDQVSKREVRIGRRQPGEVEVAEGLKAEFNMILGVMTAAQVKIMEFWLGSSYGSKMKDATIAAG
jgi:hypothetical protein